jgi:hypothetical protein
MIAPSKWLWRNVLLMCGVLLLNFLTIVLYAVQLTIDNSSRISIAYGLYAIVSTIFALVAFGIVFKKAVAGTFGYDDLYILKIKSRTCKYLKVNLNFCYSWNGNVWLHIFGCGMCRAIRR